MDMSIVFLLGLIGGLLVPQYSPLFENYLVFILSVIMFLSLLDLEFTRKIGNKRDILLVLFFNYIVLGGFLIVAGSFLELEFFEGFVVLAVTPPAVAVIPFTYILKGDLRLSVVGVSLAYLSSVVIAPIVIFMIFGERISYVGLFKTLAEFIIFPMLLAFFVSKTTLHAKIKDNRKYIMAILMFLLIYTIIGINRDNFFKSEMIYLFIIGFLKAFGIGFSVFYLLRKREMKKRISFTLFSSFKNCALSAAIALELFGERASLSPVMAIPFEIVLFLLLGFMVRKKD
jgi:BASS family bile acid:Na+ symporter